MRRTAAVGEQPTCASTTCDAGLPSAYSTPLVFSMTNWGDIVSDCTTTPCGPPDGIISVPFDVVAILDSFEGAPTAPIKARSDIEPGTPDRLINVTDATAAIDAFYNLLYPFAVNPPPCGNQGLSKRDHISRVTHRISGGPPGCAAPYDTAPETDPGVTRHLKDQAAGARSPSRTHKHGYSFP